MLREREVGREKHQGKSEILMGCLLHRSSQKPGHVPRLETKQQPLGARNDTKPTETRWPGLFKNILKEGQLL